ncbi:MAG: hypothetical protein IT273_14495 [Chitinophagales bacterium]|jgi:hypothetical protein|nr:hypothetical protein [Chitinophagales bacterium]
MFVRYLLLWLPAAIMCAILLNACNKKQKDAAQKTNTPTLSANPSNATDFYDYDYILVGNYGGITGGKRQYRIDANGTLQMLQQLKAESPTDTLKVRKLGKSDNKKLHQAVKDSHIADTQLDEPGNMTYFITLGKGTAEHTLRWGRKKDGLPDNVKQLHNTLLSHFVQRKE